MPELIRATEDPDGAQKQAENWQEIAKSHLRNEEYWRDRTMEAERDRDRFRVDYFQACETVAKMHAAIVGEVRGPDVGPLEDAQALKELVNIEMKWRQRLQDRLVEITRIARAD